jgi:hypothetical protein
MVAPNSNFMRQIQINDVRGLRRPHSYSEEVIELKETIRVERLLHSITSDARAHQRVYKAERRLSKILPEHYLAEAVEQGLFSMKVARIAFYAQRRLNGIDSHVTEI